MNTNKIRVGDVLVMRDGKTGEELHGRVAGINKHAMIPFLSLRLADEHHLAVFMGDLKNDVNFISHIPFDEVLDTISTI